MERLFSACSFLIKEQQFAFDNISINRSELIVTYSRDSQILEFIYAHESKQFLAQLRTISNFSGAIKWKSEPPPSQPLNTMRELEEHMRHWLAFIRTELGYPNQEHGSTGIESV